MFREGLEEGMDRAVARTDHAVEEDDPPMAVTTFPELSDIVATRAEIRLTAQGGAPRWITGVTLETGEKAGADEWVTSDRFTLPAP